MPDRTWPVLQRFSFFFSRHPPLWSAQPHCARVGAAVSLLAVSQWPPRRPAPPDVTSLIPHWLVRVCGTVENRRVRKKLPLEGPHLLTLFSSRQISATPRFPSSFPLHPRLPSPTAEFLDFQGECVLPRGAGILSP